MYSFGAGAIWATPLQDAYGNAITNGTPMQLGTSQDMSLNVKFDLKELYGSLQFPVAVARGKGKLDAKVKAATINAPALNTLVFGQGNTMSAGQLTAYNDLIGTALSTTSVTVTPPSSGTFSFDLGVRNGNGLPYTKVASSPATGQYSVSGSGVYTFASADNGKTVFISYQYTVTTSNNATGQTGVVKNLQMGQQPIIRLDYFSSYQGKSIVFSFPQAITGGMQYSTKLDDFIIPEFDVSLFSDGNNNVMTWSTFE